MLRETHGCFGFGRSARELGISRDNRRYRRRPDTDMFDGQERYSAPATNFGATERLRALGRHFDDLIRAAQVPPNAVGARFRALLDEIDHPAPGR